MLEVKELLSISSQFSYYEDIEIKWLSTNKFISVNELEYNMLVRNSIPDSDLFVAEIIALYSFASMPMIAKELHRLHKEPKNKDLILPSDDKQSIRKICDRLCANGIIRGFTYYTKDQETKIKVYCISDLGKTVIKKKLCTDLRYIDTMTTFEHPMEILKRLASNFIGQYISQLPGLKKVCTGDTLYLPKVGKQYIYNRQFFDWNGEKYVVLTEAISFSYDKKRITEERFFEQVKTRLETLDAYIRTLKEEHYHVRIIFGIDNLNGMKQVCQFIMNKLTYICESSAMIKAMLETKKWEEIEITPEDMPQAMKEIYFTSPQIVYNKNEIKGSLLQANNISKGQIAFRIEEMIR